MHGLALRLSIVCGVFLFAGGAAAASERIVVLRGDHCPKGSSPISAEAALSLAVSSCIVLDPQVQARFGLDGSPRISAQTCGAHAADIASLGAVLCQQEDDTPRPRAGAKLGSQPGRGELVPTPHSGKAPRFPLSLLAFPLFSLIAAYTIVDALRTGRFPGRGGVYLRRGTGFFTFLLCTYVFLGVVCGLFGIFAWVSFLRLP